tara:strand:+ start:298 stop:1053 length:756 start_codon:yes stop_codon:yes gene_type:complete
MDALERIKQQQDFNKMMKEKYPDGYTPYQEALEFKKRPENMTDLGLRMQGLKNSLYNMLFENNNDIDNNKINFESPDMNLKQLQKMISPKTATPDNTKNEAFQVFGEKSDEGTQLQQNALSILNEAGLTEEDILNLVMGSVGSVGSAKGVMGALKGMKSKAKNLLETMKSKSKFPEGYGAPQSPTPPKELPAFIRKRLDEVEPNPFKQEAIKQEEIRNALNQLMKPNTVVRPEGIKKGMRQFGKFNRQLNK